MAVKDKRQRAIDSKSEAGGAQGAITGSTIITAPPALTSIPIPFGLTGTSNLVHSAVTPSVGVSLTWTPGLGSSPTSYTVQYSTNSSFPDSLTRTVTAATASVFIDSLNANTLYYFRVAANYRQVMSGWSDVFSLTTVTDTTPPSAIAQSSMSWSWPVGDLIIKWTNPTQENFKDTRVEIWSDSGKTTKYVDTYVTAPQFVFSAAHNASVAPGGIADPSVYVELTSRSWNNVLATATTFGPASTPTTQPNKPAPATPTGLTADFTGRSCIFTWTAVSGAADYILNIDSVDYVTSSTRFDYTFDMNKVQHSGTPDPVLTYNIKARDGLLQTSAATSNATATNAAPAAVTNIYATWEGDVGYATADLNMRWDHLIPTDFDHYTVTLSKPDNSSPLAVVVMSTTFDFSLGQNFAQFGSAGQTSIKVQVQAFDVFGQGSTVYTETFTNVAPPQPTIQLFAGFTMVYAEVTHTSPVQDFDHYVYNLRSGGTAGSTDGTLVDTFVDTSASPVLNISSVGYYKLGVIVYDKFQQASTEIVSGLVFIDALTIEQLRAEGTYSNSIGTDFTTVPTGKANALLLKDNAVGAGISYTSASVTVGKTAIGGSTQDLAANTIRASKYTLASASSFPSMLVYCSGAGAGSGAQVMKGVIYTDTGSNPGTLVATTVEVSVADGQAAGWVVLPFETPINLSSGSYYLGVHGGNNTNTIRLYRDSGASLGRTNSDTYADGAAFTFATPSTVSHDYSIYLTNSGYSWTQFERPLNKIYNRIVFKVGSGFPSIYFATGLPNGDGSTTWRWWASVLSDGYTLVEYASEAAARAAATSHTSYIYQWAELPVEVDARYVRIYHSSTFRLDEYYPRTMIRADDIEAESIKAINIAAGAIVADKIAAGAVTAQKLTVGIGGGNLARDGGFMYGSTHWPSHNGGVGVNPVFGNQVPGAGSSAVGYRELYYNSGGLTVGQRYGVGQSIALDIIAGQKYTISCYVWSSSPTITLYMDFRGSGGSFVGGQSQTFNAVTDYNNLSGQPYRRIIYTGTAPVGSISVDAYVWANAATATDQIYFCGFQFEHGDVATAWKPGYRGNVQIDGEGIMVGTFNGARTELKSGGLFGFDGSNVEQVRIDSSTGFLRAGPSGSNRIEVKSNAFEVYDVFNQRVFWLHGGGGQVGVSNSFKWTLAGAGMTFKSPSDDVLMTLGGTDMEWDVTGDQGLKSVSWKYATGSKLYYYSTEDASNKTQYSPIINPLVSDTKHQTVQQSVNVRGSGVVGTIRSTVNNLTTAGYAEWSIDTSGLIYGSGYVGIRTTGNPGHALTVNSVVGNYSIVCRNSSSGNLFWAADNGTLWNNQAWAISSDVTLKENILDLDKGLDFVLSLKPKKFDYKRGAKKQWGFVAQEVQPIAPELIVEDMDGNLAMKYELLIPALVNAIYELNEQVKELKGGKGNAGGVGGTRNNTNK